MRIGIEAQRIFRHRKHGMDMVALELIRNLQEIDTENEYVIFVKPDIDRCLSETENFRIIDLPAAPHPIWEQVYLPEAAAIEKCDILHCTSNTAPVFCKMPLIITLHDITYMESNGLFKQAFTHEQKKINLYRRYIVPKAVRRSERIITVSEYEKQNVASFFQLDSHKLTAVYNGVGTHFKKIDLPVELEYIKAKYQLPDRFIFFLGNTNPKKNVRNTLAGYSMYYKGASEKLPLVMLDYGKDDLLKIARELNDEQLPNHIILTGYISNAELPSVYSLAEIMLYPSLRESFGIPVLEAMACGVPVITSNTTSMPEVAGDAALLVDPTQPEEIAEAIEKLLTDKELVKKMVELGYHQSARFSWRVMAKHILEIYNEIGRERNLIDTDN